MNFNKGQAEGYKQFMAGRNLFITGSGGVGKSVLVNYIRDHHPGVLFYGPTGISAQNIKGVTLHRGFGLQLGVYLPHMLERVPQKVLKVFSNTNVRTIVIDEVSMVRADVFIALDRFLRLARRKNTPFGGLQVIVVGDFFQLSPVVNSKSQEYDLFYSEYRSPFAFNTPTWKEAGFVTVDLKEVMRTSDQLFIAHQQNIRLGNDDVSKSVEFFNDMCTNVENAPGDLLILCSTNADAATINQDAFEGIDGPARTYTARIGGQFKDYPVDREIHLKVGTKVLLCANDPEDTYQNGSVGYVTSMAGDIVTVELMSGAVVSVGRFEWTERDYQEVNGKLEIVEVGSFSQFPFKLGYAITIHKSQGLSLDAAAIYTGQRGAFAHGQVYVALSRLRSLAGLFLLQPLSTREIIVDDHVRKFYASQVATNIFDMSL